MALSNYLKFRGRMPGGSLLIWLAFFWVSSLHGRDTTPFLAATGVSWVASEPYTCASLVASLALLRTTSSAALRGVLLTRLLVGPSRR
jgi:hypothetical protein